jgi:hypothetical protein
MINSMNWLSNHILDKSISQKYEFAELESTLANLDEKYMMAMT